MALVVEDGTGLTGANSYISEADADTYVAERVIGAGKTAWDSASSADKESALIRGTAYLDENYLPSWKGSRGSADQALDWPRINVIDEDGYLVASDAVPGQLSSALVEIAVTTVSATDPLSPELTTSGTIRLERVKAGPVESEIEYSNPAQTNLTASQRFPKAHKMLTDLIDASNILPLG